MKQANCDIRATTFDFHKTNNIKNMVLYYYVPNEKDYCFLDMYVICNMQYTYIFQKGFGNVKAW
jgi:hypothetical protein